MLYYYWKTKGKYPSEIHNKSSGEKLVIRAFYEKEIEERRKQGHGCPYL